MILPFLRKLEFSRVLQFLFLGLSKLQNGPNGPLKLFPKNIIVIIFSFSGDNEIGGQKVRWKFFFLLLYFLYLGRTR